MPAAEPRRRARADGARRAQGAAPAPAGRGALAAAPARGASSLDDRFTFAVAELQKTLALVLGEMQDLHQELEELGTAMPGERIAHIERVLAGELARMP